MESLGVGYDLPPSKIPRHHCKLLVAIIAQRYLSQIIDSTDEFLYFDSSCVYETTLTKDD